MNHLIPMPASIKPLVGEFTLTDQTKIIIESRDPEILALGNLLKEYVEEHTKLQPEVTTRGEASGNILLDVCELSEP